MRILKRTAISLLVAALAFLAAFIIAVNLYATWMAFAHTATSRATVLFFGFVTAAVVSVLALGLTLYLTRRKNQTASESN